MEEKTTLSRNDLVEVACRVLGIYCLVMAAAYIPFLIAEAAVAFWRAVGGGGTTSASPSARQLITLFAAPLGLLLLGLYLIRRRSILRPDSAWDLPLDLPLVEGWEIRTFALASRVLGAAFLITGIADIVAPALVGFWDDYNTNPRNLNPALEREAMFWGRVGQRAWRRSRASTS